MPAFVPCSLIFAWYVIAGGSYAPGLLGVCGMRRRSPGSRYLGQGVVLGFHSISLCLETISEVLGRVSSFVTQDQSKKKTGDQ